VRFAAFNDPITTVAELRNVIGPPPASAEGKARTGLDALCGQYVQRAKEDG
jgi:hypothetical protein